MRGDVGGIRELLGEYIRTVKGGTIEPHVDNNWKLVGNNWNAADHEKAVKLLREGKLALSENADSRTLPGKAITRPILPHSDFSFTRSGVCSLSGAAHPFLLHDKVKDQCGLSGGVPLFCAAYFFFWRFVVEYTVFICA